MTPLSVRSKQIRRDCLKLGLPNGIYHYGGSFSVVEILIALYDRIGIKPEDRVIMSKGHAWLPQVVILREHGKNPGFGPRLDDPSVQCLVGHPFRDPANGIFANTGSLGHGMPLGVGMALAKKLQKQPGHVYVIIGDGEAQEGTFWESLLLGRKFQLNNLTVIVDANAIQGSGRVGNVLPLDWREISNAGSAVGWNSSTCNGHNANELSVYLTPGLGPKLVVARTIKGCGVSFMEHDPAWHAQYPSPEQIEQAYKELA